MLVGNIGGVEGASRVSGKPMHMHVRVLMLMLMTQDNKTN
jgi:hypothetical protein